MDTTNFLMLMTAFQPGCPPVAPLTAGQFAVHALALHRRGRGWGAHHLLRLVAVAGPGTAAAGDMAMTDEQAAHDDAAKAGAHDPAAACMAAEAFTGSMTDAFATAVRQAVAEQATTGLPG